LENGAGGVTFAAHNFMEKIIIVEQFLLDEWIYGQARKSFVILLIPRNCERALNYLPLRALLRLCALISPFACLGNVSGGGKLFGEDTSLSLMMARLHHLIVLN